jgi:hypothetical protein
VLRCIDRTDVAGDWERDGATYSPVSTEQMLPVASCDNRYVPASYN